MDDQLTPGDMVPTGTCKLCPHTESWTHDEAVVNAMVWHVYEAHRKRWITLIGDREPINPRPETVPGAIQM